MLFAQICPVYLVLQLVYMDMYYFSFTFYSKFWQQVNNAMNQINGEEMLIVSYSFCRGFCSMRLLYLRADLINTVFFTG